MSDTIDDLALWRMGEQEREGVTFLTYRNSEGLRVSHPVRIESLSKNPAPWFPRVYSPDEVRKMVDKE